MDLFFYIGIVAVIFILSGLKVVNQYERGVVLTLGKFSGLRNPGLNVIVPIFQRMITVDVRTNTIDIPKQEVITKDNVTVNVDAVVYFLIVAPQPKTSSSGCGAIISIFFFIKNMTV